MNEEFAEQLGEVIDWIDKRLENRIPQTEELSKDICAALILEWEKARLKPLMDFINMRIEANTYNNNGIKWNLPHNHINIPLSQILKALNKKIDE